MLVANGGDSSVGDASNRPGRRDVLAGAVLILLGAFFAWSGRGLLIGSADQMGPGYMPMALSGLLVLFGLVVLAGGLLRGGEGIGRLSWRGVGLVTAGLMFFGLLVRPLGLGPALAGAVFLASLGSRRWSLLPSLFLTATMVIFAWAVFIKGLGVPIRMLGPWLG